MTWHLKDRELEEKLIAIDPEFVDKLQIKEGCGNYGFYLDLGGCVYCGDVGVPKIQVYFVQEDLEEVPEYNPHDWNEYPAVTPPDGVLMKVECFSLIFRKLCRTCAIFCNGQWFVELAGEADTEFPLENTMIKVKRFRPWNED